MITSDSIELRVPADPAYLAVIRTAAAGHAPVRRVGRNSAAGVELAVYVLDVHLQNGGARLPRCCDGVGHRRECLLAPGHENEFVAVGGKPMRERRPDTGRRSCDQRDRAFFQRHWQIHAPSALFGF